MKTQLEAVCALIQTVGDINKDVNYRTWAKSIANYLFLYLIIISNNLAQCFK